MASLPVLLHELQDMKKINEIIKNSINSYLKNPKSICVALSGGADSVCLLHCLKAISVDVGFVLSAVHINHNIRGDEAKRDENFCISLCEKLNIPLKVFNVYVLEQAEKGESIELAARRLRYKVFEEIESEYIATAHNADDSLETFLINFCRGTGLRGLTGIPDIRGRFIRPLNNCSKSDILEYIKQNGLEYVVDSTNLSDDYTRNKIRNNIIPKLKEISPEIINISSRNIDLLKCDSDFLEAEANKLFKESVCENKCLKVKTLLSAHKSLTTRVLLKYVYEVTNRYPDSYHLKLLFDLLYSKIASVGLYNGFYAKVSKGYLYVKKDEDESFFVETEVISKKNFNNQCKINKLLLKNAIDYDKIIGELIIRERAPSDRLSPLGRGLSKPVRRLQAEADVPVILRDKAPIAADSIGVVWGYKIGVDERVAIDENTKKVLVFKVYKSKNGGQ